LPHLLVLRSKSGKKSFHNISGKQGSTGKFISPSRTSELGCTTTKIDTAERSISVGTESLQVFFLCVLGAVA